MGILYRLVPYSNNSSQNRDIVKAKELAKELKNDRKTDTV